MFVYNHENIMKKLYGTKYFECIDRESHHDANSGNDRYRHLLSYDCVVKDSWLQYPEVSQDKILNDVEEKIGCFKTGLRKPQAKSFLLQPNKRRKSRRSSFVEFVANALMLN